MLKHRPCVNAWACAADSRFRVRICRNSYFGVWDHGTVVIGWFRTLTLLAHSASVPYSSKVQSHAHCPMHASAIRHLTPRQSQQISTLTTHMHIQCAHTANTPRPSWPVIAFGISRFAHVLTYVHKATARTSATHPLQPLAPHPTLCSSRPAAPQLVRVGGWR